MMKRKIYIQILGVLSCLAVVVLHTNGCFWDFSYERYWLTANLIENLCYFAVPIFFMISGSDIDGLQETLFYRRIFQKKILEDSCSISDLVSGRNRMDVF